jgi:hypothetical protein
VFARIQDLEEGTEQFVGVVKSEQTTGDDALCPRLQRIKATPMPAMT